jgi:vitamin B12 transporter
MSVPHFSIPNFYSLNPSSMMNKEKNVWAITFLIACWWLAPNQTSAQQDSLTSTSLDAVVVTATKTPKSLSETGKVLTVIDEQQIQQSAGKDLSQLLNEQTGLFINGANSNPGKDKSVYLRGAKSEYTVILVDGIPLTDPSAIGGGAYDLRLIPLDQVQRIEILKGNQSTLYGSNAIAGVINIITKKEGDNKVGGSALLSYGSFNTMRATAQVSGGTTRLGYTIGASRLSTDGLSEAKEGANESFENDGFNQEAFYSTVTIKPSKKVQVEPYFRYSNFDGRYDGGPFVDDPGNRYTSTFRNVGATARYSFTRGTLHAQYGYDFTNRNFLDATFGTSRYKGRFHHSEVFFNYKISQRWELLSGINAQQWQMLDEAASKKDPDFSLVSPYASLMLNDWNGFSMEVGARFNRHSQSGNNVTYSINPSYLFAKKLKGFVNVATGFKAPSLQQLYGQFGPNPDLKPETSFNVEAGAQLFIPQRGDVRVVAFDRTIKQLIFYAFPQGYTNRNEQHDRGIDVEGTVNISKKLNARIFYSFVTGELTAANGDETENLYRIPRHSLGLFGQYTILPNWTMSLNYRWTGSRADLYFNPDTFLSERVTLEAFHLLDFYTEFSFANKKLKTFLDAKNLLNQNYFESYGYTTLPMNVQVGISVKL